MRLLFVCTGNTCRSPLAEAIARKVAVERGLGDVDVASAGTSAWDGAPASDGALLVGMERRLDLSGHRAQSLTRRLVDGSDLILAMGPHHLDRIEALGDSSKAFLLADFASHGASGFTQPAVEALHRDNAAGSCRSVTRPASPLMSSCYVRVFIRPFRLIKDITIATRDGIIAGMPA